MMHVAALSFGCGVVCRAQSSPVAILTVARILARHNALAAVVSASHPFLHSLARSATPSGVQPSPNCKFISCQCPVPYIRRGWCVIVVPADVILVLRVAPLVSERIKRSTHPGGASTSGDDDDASDLKFTIPADLPAWQRAVARFLQRRAKLPDLALAWIFQIGLNRIMCLLAFLALAPVAARFELGPIFVLTAIIAAIFTNLGKRREGEASGYSIFNDGVQRLPGEMINAEALDQQLRRGELMR